MQAINDLFGGIPHCKRCNLELSGSERVCPRCEFAPRQAGFWLAGIGILGVVAAMMIAQLTAVLAPRVGLYFMMLAVPSFVFAIVSFSLAMIATPYRLGGLFNLISRGGNP